MGVPHIERDAAKEGTDVRFITLIVAVTKLPPDLHTIAFEIRRPRAAMFANITSRFTKVFGERGETNELVQFAAT